MTGEVKMKDRWMDGKRSKAVKQMEEKISNVRSDRIRFKVIGVRNCTI